MKKKRIPARGTVSLQNGKILPLRVLRFYLAWGETPHYWSNARAGELAAAIGWALRNLDPKAKRSLEREEKKWE